MTEPRPCHWCDEPATTTLRIPVPSPPPRTVPEALALPPKVNLRDERYPACQRHFESLGGKRP